MTDPQTITLEAERIDGDVEDITLEAELVDEEADREIDQAVSARHSIARKYVQRLRRRRPDATPAEVIAMLERHYTTSITAAGIALAAGGFAVEYGVGMLPGGGAATAVTKKVGKVALKQAVKSAAKTITVQAAKNGATALLPAGEQQLQFEITAIFGLAVAEIHGLALDRDQAHRMVRTLTDDRVSRQQLGALAAALTAPAAKEKQGESGPARTSLADALPAGAVQNLVRSAQSSEQVQGVRDGMSEKQRARVEHGMEALSTGVTRFHFGREVVAAARVAFPAAPAAFPAHLAVPVAADADELEREPNRAIAALEQAASSTGGWISGTADNVTRVFRSVDLDGDGIPDEPQALTAVKGVGGAIAGAAGTVGDGIGGLFKAKKRGRHAAGGED